jgi:hypothetical protein
MTSTQSAPARASAVPEPVTRATVRPVDSARALLRAPRRVGRQEPVLDERPESPIPVERGVPPDEAVGPTSSPAAELAPPVRTRSRPATPTGGRSLLDGSQAEPGAETAPLVRPTVRLARSKQLAAHAAPSPDSERSTSGTRLAEAAGAVLSRADDGLETVDFPWASPPSEIVTTAPSVPAALLSRAPADAAPEPEEIDAPPATPPEAPAPTGRPSPAPPSAPDMDDVYEQVVDRLRRDLLVERERMGDLLGDLP